MQTGKSFVLNNILPAVVAGDSDFGIGGRHEVAIIRLDLGGLPMHQVCCKNIAGSKAIR